MNGQGVPGIAQKERLELAFGRVLLREFVTPEAVDQEYWAAHKTGPETYWARRWKQARGVAMDEVFTDGLPPKTQLRTLLITALVIGQSPGGGSSSSQRRMRCPLAGRERSAEAGMCGSPLGRPASSRAICPILREKNDDRRDLGGADVVVPQRRGPSRGAAPRLHPPQLTHGCDTRRLPRMAAGLVFRRALGAGRVQVERRNKSEMA